MGGMAWRQQEQAAAGRRAQAGVIAGSAGSCAVPAPSIGWRFGGLVVPWTTGCPMVRVGKAACAAVQGQTLKEAVELVKTQRPQAHPYIDCWKVRGVGRWARPAGGRGVA